MVAAAQRLEEGAVNFSQRRDEILRATSDILNERQVTGLMYMVDIGRLSSTRYAELTRSSQATALTDLNLLLERGLAARVGSGKSTRYGLSHRLAQVIHELPTERAKRAEPTA